MAANEAPTGQQPARCHQQRHGILPVCAPELCSATLPPTPVPLLEVNPRKFSDPDSWDCSRIGGWGLGHLWGSDHKKGECPSLTVGVEWRTEWRLPGELVQWWTQRPQAWAQVALTHVLAHHTWGLRQPPHVGWLASRFHLGHCTHYQLAGSTEVSASQELSPESRQVRE